LFIGCAELPDIEGESEDMELTDGDVEKTTDKYMELAGADAEAANADSEPADADAYIAHGANRGYTGAVSDSEPESVDISDTSRFKRQRRRWTSDEQQMVFTTFGKDITNKTIPSGERLADLVKRMNTGRSVA